MKGKKKIYVITGQSGSGKSTALAALEDAGFYCVDNMPVTLLPRFLEIPIEGAGTISGLALVMDLREKSFLSDYKTVFTKLEEEGYDIEIIFLHANQEILIQRYNQTRRHHPLANGDHLLDGIREERGLLEPVKKRAGKVIDTSKLNVHELKFQLMRMVQKEMPLTPMGINILSFGYKYGIPTEADLIMDVRFLKNPYFVPELKNLTGETKKIRDFVLNNDKTCLFLQKYLDLLEYLIPLYDKEGKAYLTIAVGCTGGRHRSVAIAWTLFEKVKKDREMVNLSHRDIGRSSTLQTPN